MSFSLHMVWRNIPYSINAKEDSGTSSPRASWCQEGHQGIPAIKTLLHIAQQAGYELGCLLRETTQPVQISQFCRFYFKHTNCWIKSLILLFPKLNGNGLMAQKYKLYCPQICVLLVNFWSLLLSCNHVVHLCVQSL